MRCISILTLVFHFSIIFGQSDNRIGQLKMLDAKIVMADTVTESICGYKTQTIRLTVFANSVVQLSCNYFDQSKNIYDTVTNKFHLYHTHDTMQLIYKAVINEIKNYINERENWAIKYKVGKDFSHLALIKSFFVSKDKIIPFIWSGSERNGDYQIYYLNDQVYKIVLVEGKGLGCLSSFAKQNCYFQQDNDKLKLDNYVKNIDIAKQILARQ